MVPEVVAEGDVSHLSLDPDPLRGFGASVQLVEASSQ